MPEVFNYFRKTLFQMYDLFLSSHKILYKRLSLSWRNGLVVKALDSQSTDLVFKTIGWLQGRLSHSSFRGR